MSSLSVSVSSSEAERVPALNRLNQEISMAQEEHEAEKEEFVAVRKADLERIMALLSRLENKDR